MKGSFDRLGAILLLSAHDRRQAGAHGRAANDMGSGVHMRHSVRNGHAAAI